MCSVIQALNVCLPESSAVNDAFMIWKKETTILEIIELADAHEQRLQRSESL